MDKKYENYSKYFYSYKLNIDNFNKFRDGYMKTFKDVEILNESDVIVGKKMKYTIYDWFYNFNNLELKTDYSEHMVWEIIKKAE